MVLACSHRPAAPQHAEPALTPPPVLFVEQAGEPPPGVVELGPTCPALVAAHPSPFFEESLLIRLPAELEGEQVTERDLGFARSPWLALGCEPGLAARVVLERRSAAAHDSISSARARLFADLNFPVWPKMLILDGSDEHRDISFSLGFPGDSVWGEYQVYVRMFERYDHVYSVAFIAERRSYHKLEPVFAASAKSMLALPG